MYGQPSVHKSCLPVCLSGLISRAVGQTAAASRRVRAKWRRRKYQGSLRGRRHLDANATGVHHPGAKCTGWCDEDLDWPLWSARISWWIWVATNLPVSRYNNFRHSDKVRVLYACCTCLCASAWCSVRLLQDVRGTAVYWTSAILNRASCAATGTRSGMWPLSVPWLTGNGVRKRQMLVHAIESRLWSSFLRRSFRLTHLIWSHSWCSSFIY
jgi:hypothetical protein